MTPNEITTLLASNFDRELDIPFRLQLMERVKYWRSRMVANAIGKDPSKRAAFRQPLYIPMVTAYAADCIAGIGDKQSISEENIPMMITVGGQLFDYVGGIDGRSPFRKIDPGTANYLSTGRHAYMFPAYEYNGRKLYINKTGIPVVRVDGIFDDPLLAQQMNCACSDTPADCDTWDMEFPCSGDIMQLIIQSILQVDYNRPDKEPTEEVPVSK